jgi:type VII secretion integral membrane protein EccD
VTTGVLAPPAAVPPQAAPTAEVARARIAVLVATYQVDVVVPTKFAVETFMDDLLAVLAEALGDGSVDFTPPTGQWSLARPGQAPIPRWRTLADHDVDDGTVLQLCPVESAEVFTPIVEDITDALALVNDREFAEFDGRTAAVFGLAVWGAATSVVALLLAWLWTQTASIVVSAVPAVGLGVICWGAAILASRLGASMRIRLGLALAAIPPLFAGGAMLVPTPFGEPGNFQPANLAVGAIIVAVAAATLIRLTRTGIATLTAVTVLGLLVGIAMVGVVYLEIDVDKVAAGTVFIGLVLLAMAPRMAVFIAKIHPPDLPDPGDAVHPGSLTDIFDSAKGTDADPDLDTEQRNNEVGIEGRARLAVTTLRGLVAAFCAVTAAATVIVCAVSPGGIREIVMAAAVSGTLVLRARWFPDLVQALAFLTAAGAIVIGVVAVLFEAYATVPARLAVLGVALCITVLGGVAALRLPGVRLSPVTRRMIDLVEYALLIVVPVIAIWIMGIYTAMRRI